MSGSPEIWTTVRFTMKVLKKIAIVGAVLLALLALIVALAFVPSIQTWAVRRATSSMPGMKLDIARVSAGLSSADLRDVRVDKDGMVITVKHATASYSAWDFIAHRRVTVNDLAVEDLLIDLRNMKPAAQAAPSKVEPRQPFNGLLNQATLPFDVQIARFAVPGRALLPDSQTAAFEIRGSDIVTGRRGAVDWKADLTNDRKDSPVRALHTTGTASVHITTERRIDLAEVNANASAEGASLPADQVKLEARLEQPTAGGNEGYSAKVSLVHGSTTEPLLTLAAQYDASAKQIAGAWNATVRTEQLAALLRGFGLPDTALTGAGKFSVKPDTNALTANGELQADLSHLEKVSAELATVGSLNVQTRFDVAVNGNVAQLSQLSLDATAANGRKLAQIATLQKIAFALDTKRVSFADARADLARISIQSLPLAWAQPFAKPLLIDGGELSMVLAVAAEADGSRVRVTAVEPLTVRELTVRQGSSRLVDRLSVSVKPQAEYAGDHAHAELNELALSMPAGDRVTGRLVADVTDLNKSPKVAFTSDMQTQIVAALKPYLPVEMGPLSVSSRSEGTYAGSTLVVAKAATEIHRASPSGPLLASIELVQPVTVDLNTTTPSVAKPDADAAQVRLGTIPLSWAEAFVPNSKLGGQLSGAALAVKIRGANSVEANTTEPVTVRGATVSMNGQPMAQNVDVIVDFSAAKQGDNVRYNVRKLEARQGSAVLASLTANGEATLGAKIALTAKGTLDADLAALTQQPAAASAVALAKGNVNATFDATIRNTIDAKVNVSVRNLVAKQGNQPLGEAELALTATVQPDGSSVLKVPFTFVKNGRKSDVTLEGRLTQPQGGISFDGRITGSQIFVDDLQPLAGLAPSTPAQAATPSAQKTPAPKPAVTAATSDKDTQPFWAGAGGSIEIDLKQITYGQDYVISGVRGTAVINARQLALRSLEGKLKENPFKLAASVDFDASQPQPYTLAAVANINGLAVGPILQSLNPNEKPQLETNVTVDSKIGGQCTNLRNLMMNAYGNFDVTGSKGVLRALANKTGRTVGGVSSIAGLAGAFLNNQNTAAAVSAGADLAGKLAELPFDGFSMHVNRGADLAFKIGSIEFISPDTRLSGSGEIANQPGVAIANQPMKITLTLAGKDNMAFLLDKAGLLSGNKDDKGYYTMSTNFTVGGTPAKADSNELWRIIAEAGLKAAAGKFLGK